jgi:hypothetical protein
MHWGSVGGQAAWATGVLSRKSIPATTIVSESTSRIDLRRERLGMQLTGLTPFGASSYVLPWLERTVEEVSTTVLDQ